MSAPNQSAAAGCDAARQLREAALPLPRGSEQSREEIEKVVSWCVKRAVGNPPQPMADTIAFGVEQLLALSTAHAEGLGKGEDYAVQTHVDPQHCTGWRDIASAPRDGTWFLAYRPSPQDAGVWNTLVAVAWNDEAEDFVWPDDIYDPYAPPDLSAQDHGGWFVTEVFEGRGSFTHWMPLPAPPSSELTDQQRGAPLEGEA